MIWSGYLDDGDHGYSRWGAWERDGERVKHGVVTDHKVPVGLRGRRVSASGTRDLQGVSRLGLGGPRPRDTPIAVHHEIEGQQPILGIPGANRVGTHLVREPALDVMIGEGADTEVLKIVASND